MYSPDDCVKFDRVTEEPLCACVYGTFSTNQVDRHGHRINPVVYERSLGRLQSNPELRIATIQHDESQQLGEILWVGIREDEEGVTHFVGGIGVFESSRYRLDEIEESVFGGFSIEYGLFVNIEEDEWDPDTSTFEYHGPGEDLRQLQLLAEANDFPAFFSLGKSVAGGLVAEFAIENWRELLDVAIITWVWYKSKRSGSSDEPEREDEETKVVIRDNTIILAEQDEDEFLEKVVTALGMEMDQDGLDNLREQVDKIERQLEKSETTEVEQQD